MTASVTVQPARLVYVDHIEARFTELFRFVCESDLEGIVAKHAASVYADRVGSWVKIKNPDYNQAQGRREMFEGFHRHARVWSNNSSGHAIAGCSTLMRSRRLPV